MKSSTPSWLEWNRQRLTDALREVRGHLVEEEARVASAPAQRPKGDARSALEIIVEAFNLSPFERDLLLLCTGVELDGELAAIVAHLQPGGTVLPTPALALRFLPGAHWSAFSPDAALRRWRLVDVQSSPLLVQSPLKIDERALHFLCGVQGLDDRLRGILRPAPQAQPLAASHEAVAKNLTLRLADSPYPILQVSAPPHCDALAVVAAAAQFAELRLSVARSVDLPAAPAEREALARLWEREAALGAGAVAIDASNADATELCRAVAWLEDMSAPAFILTRQPFAAMRRKIVRMDLALPPAPEQLTLWRSALGPLADQLNGELPALVRQFRLGPQAIAAAAAQLRVAATPKRAKPAAAAAVFEEMHRLCRVHARVPLESLTQILHPAATWNDLVLPREVLQRLRDIASHVRQRHRIDEDWGFGAKSSRGLGIAALFSGASGVGKTMAAEVLANELGLDLFRIDLSSVVSKYIGDTEKNLRSVFDAADAGGAILLFDEADALFGKRSEVRDSHDRYANIEVSYLLQRMEEYRGLAILTTNMKASLDSAFLRRLRFVIEFPFPDHALRAEMWRRVFPKETPTDGLAPERLARLGVSGGHIYNIALSAAVMAADGGKPVQMSHLLAAARSECAKMDRPPSEAEMGGWV